MKTPTAQTAMKVLVISRDEIIQKDITKVLESDNDFLVIENSFLEDGVVQSIQLLKPDIVLIEEKYCPPDEMVDIIDDISILHPETSIIAIITSEDLSTANQLIMAGARAFIPYPFSHKTLLSSLYRVKELHSRLFAGARKEEENPQTQKSQSNFLVFSPKGGVGCTTVAINLAIALKQELGGEEVLLVDGKHLFGHISLMLNMKTANSIVDLIPHAGTLDDNLIRQVVVKHASGIQVLPGPFSAVVAQSIRLEDLFEVYQGLQKVFPNMVIDAGNYLNEQVVTLMDTAQRIILVITPDLASLRDARLFLDICRSLSYHQRKILIVMNKVSGKNEITQGDIEKALRMKIFGCIPADENQSIGSLNEGVPIIQKNPNHAISKACKKLAKNLMDNAHNTETNVLLEPSSETLIQSSRLG